MPDITAKINVNTSLKKITIDPTNLNIQNIKLSTSGAINYSDRSSVDIKFKNEKANARKLIGILPSSMKTSFKNLKLDLANKPKKLKKKFDVLIHCAAYTPPKYSINEIKKNYLINSNIIKIAKDTGIKKIIYAIFLSIPSFIKFRINTTIPM